MIKIKNFVFSDFQENTYVLSEDNGECIIIDPGCYTKQEQLELKAYLDSNRLALKQVVFTHCHLDHVFGAGFISKTYQGINLVAHKEEAFFIEQGKQQALMFGIQMENPPALTEYIQEGDVIQLDKTLLKVIHAPGHSAGSLCFYCPDQKFIVAGDVLFAGSIGRADLPGGDMDTLLSSIRNRLFTLPDDTVVLSGHGPSTVIKHEKKYNPFF